MTFVDDYRDHDDEQARRFRNRSILFFIILATIPCYLIGAVMLAFAPDNDEPSVINETQPPLQSTSSRIGTATGSPTAVGSPTVTLFPGLVATETQRSSLPNTPFQFVPPTATPRPSSTLAPSLTPNASSTPTNTPTRTNTPVPSNNQPVFDTLPVDTTIGIGESATISFTFSDPDGDAVSFTAASSAPSIVAITSFDVSAFTVQGAASGMSTITVTLTDARNATNTATITVTVASPNQPPIFTVEPAPITLDEGNSTTVTFAVSDPDGDTVTVELTSDNPAVASVTRIDGVSFSVIGNAAGSANLTVSISDGNGGIDGRIFAVTVNAVQINNPPEFIVEPASISVQQGDSTVIGVQATDVDGDSVTLSVASGNPSILTATIIDNASFTVQGIAAGDTTVTITLSDGQTTTERIVNATVGAANSPPQFDTPPLDVNMTVGENFNYQLFISDPNGDAITLTVASADPGIATVTKIDNRNFRVTGVSASTVIVTITLDDGRGGVTTETISVIVTS